MNPNKTESPEVSVRIARQLEQESQGGRRRRHRKDSAQRSKRWTSPPPAREIDGRGGRAGKRETLRGRKGRRRLARKVGRREIVEGSIAGADNVQHDRANARGRRRARESIEQKHTADTTKAIAAAALARQRRNFITRWLAELFQPRARRRNGLLFRLPSVHRASKPQPTP